MGYSVFQAIEKTKIGLSSETTANFTYRNMGITIDEEISLATYNGIIEKDITRINAYLNEFLTTNNINPLEIDSLFLTGGTSMVSAVQGLFKTKFPHLKINSGDNFKSVAKGLAYSGYLFETED
ncbi:Hsp70 family protein [Pedobacter sp. UC225_65]|uniref:Hsp70 family protein n=1 Tax=Pedobacter sp. UC225_65 TaxID=3350173 RepID=UPI003670AB70